MKRFKIDLTDWARYPYGFFVLRKGWFCDKWEKLDSFQTREEAMTLYERIKDLPEYLD